MAAIPQRIEYRGVMVVGKTGAGKSTVANAIIGSDNRFRVSSSLQSCTYQSDHCEVMLPDNASGCTYRAKIMDTVGLFDTGPITNDQTIAALKAYVNTHFSDGINLIIFVLREGRFTPEEKRSLDFIREKFSNEISEISALVITNCDQMTEDARTRLVEEFKTNPLTKDTADFMKAGIYTVGFPSREFYCNLPEMFKHYFEQSIAKDRIMLWNIIKRHSRAKLYRQLYRVSFWEHCTIL